ncbi:MAG: hypothetical protein ACM31C_03810 [Acidobacteriota bacterium]
MRFACLGLLALAACPPRGNQPQTTPQPEANGPGCPTAAGVYTASYLTQDPAKGRSGWVMPLHAMQVDPGASTKLPDYAPMDATAASVSGVPPAPTGTLWLMTAQGAPCQAKLGSYYAAKLPGPPASLAYGIELDGCAAPQDPQEAGGIVFVADQAPTGCQLEAPRPVATRMGEMDAQKQWHPPAKETPIPPALAAVIPPHACTPPSCQTLWAIGEVDANDQPVAWSGAVNWLAIGDPAQPCTWKADRYSGFWIPGPDGKPLKIEDGQTQPLVLSAVLVDRSGPRALLAEGPGEYATYDLAPGKATLAHHTTWMLVPNAAWEAVDHLGPMCEHPEAAPAPLPKDAKPQSPY